jgi:hypothetical protein
MIWPLQSVSDNQFHNWVADLLYQVHRQNNNFGNIMENFLVFDPVVLILGLAGIGYAILKKDSVILLWFLPFLGFLVLVGYSQYFYWIPVLPVLCIGASKFVLDLGEKAKQDVRHKVPYVIIICIGGFGFAMTCFLITSDVSAQYDATAYVLQTVHNNDPNEKNNTTIVSSAAYSWIFKYVYHIPDTMKDYRTIMFRPIPTDHVVLIVDLHFKSNMNSGKQLSDLYYNTTMVKQFKGGVLDEDLGKYPFTSMNANYEGSEVEIRTK